MSSSIGFVRFRDDQLIKVGKILCLGRNYVNHAREMNANIPEKPLIFLKPSTALLQNGGSVVIPPFSTEVHHEVEMVVLIGKRAKQVDKATALEYVSGYAVGLDMTLRDLQEIAKEKGLPWSVAKGFDTSAPVSEFVEAGTIKNPHDLNISLKVNGVLRQSANTREMIFSLGEVISYASSVFTLEAGDLIFTGTPSGVGKVVPGDELEADLESVGKLKVRIRSQEQSMAGKG